MDLGFAGGLLAEFIVGFVFVSAVGGELGCLACFAEGEEKLEERRRSSREGLHVPDEICGEAAAGA